MAPGDSTPLSLRPFPVADKQPKNIADFITRINAQPGGFRSVTESQLSEEALRQAHDIQLPDHGDVDMSDGDEEGEDDDAAAQDPNQARMEVLKNIE